MRAWPIQRRRRRRSARAAMCAPSVGRRWPVRPPTRTPPASPLIAARVPPDRRAKPPKSPPVYTAYLDDDPSGHSPRSVKVGSRLPTVQRSAEARQTVAGAITGVITLLRDPREHAGDDAIAPRPLEGET